VIKDEWNFTSTIFMRFQGAQKKTISTTYISHEVAIMQV
jgi:hypothetical protein